MNRMLRMIVALTLTAMAPGGTAAAGASAGPQPYAGAQFRYGAFSNNNDLRDVLAYWVPGPFHVQLEVWDFVRGNDQFRPEIGLHLRDARRSVYTLQWRHERDAERYWLGTDQVLSRHLVGRVEASPIVAHQSRTDWVYAGGLDYYWADYDFADVDNVIWTAGVEGPVPAR